MPTTRNRWQQEVHQSPEPVPDDKQANQANTDKKRQTSPQRPSVSPAPELASDLQDDPNPRSPKRMRLSADETDEPKQDTARAPVPSPINPPSTPATVPQQSTGIAQPSAEAPVQTANPTPAPNPSPMPPAQAPAPPTVTAPSLSTPNRSSTTPTIAHAPGNAPPRQGTVPTAPPAPSTATPPPARGPPPPPAEIVKRRLDNLPKLGELADQILSLLSKMPVLDALALDADLRLLSSGQQPSSPAPAEYQRLRALFDPIRNFYVTGFPFLITDHLAMKDPAQVAIIRKANQAMFCAAIFGGGIGQLALDQAFLDIFVPENGQLLKAQSSIWLELKTQGFMTAMRLKAAPPNQVMSDLFPAGIETRIVARHPVSRALAPSEQEFVARYEARRKILFDHITRTALPDLDQKFTYVELAREVANFLIKTYGTGHEPSSGKPPIANPAPGQQQTAAQGPGSNTAPRVSPVPPPQLPASIANLPSFDSGDFIELAARAAEIAMRGTASPTLEQAPLPPQPVPPAQADPQPHNNGHSDFQHYTPAQNGTASKPHVPLDPSNGIPHASQTAPTHVLYQRARMAEPAKSSTPGTPRSEAEASYQRRTWSEDEEKALMDGLDRVQGPHWANIMVLHGPGGSLSEALKDRNQVQLKDKARNLKLFFLKNKIEVPYYLSTVTGTLESRAPGQVEKAESEVAEQGPKEGASDALPKQRVEDLTAGQDQSMTETTLKAETKDGVSNAGAAAGDLDDVEAMLAKAAAEAVKSV